MKCDNCSHCAKINTEVKEFTTVHDFDQPHTWPAMVGHFCTLAGVYMENVNDCTAFEHKLEKNEKS